MNCKVNADFPTPPLPTIITLWIAAFDIFIRIYKIQPTLQLANVNVKMKPEIWLSNYCCYIPPIKFYEDVKLTILRYQSGLVYCLVHWLPVIIRIRRFTMEPSKFKNSQRNRTLSQCSCRQIKTLQNSLNIHYRLSFYWFLLNNISHDS